MKERRKEGRKKEGKKDGREYIKILTNADCTGDRAGPSSLRTKVNKSEKRRRASSRALRPERRSWSFMSVRREMEWATVRAMLKKRVY